MGATWGPVEFSGPEIAVIFAIFGLVPPLLIAVVGWVVHAFLLTRQSRDVKLLPLFLRWLGWSALAWIGGWLLAAMFAGGS